MKVLSIDSSSNICGVSILDDENLICNLDEDTGRTHSENLMPMVDNAFKKSNLSLNDIDLIVCDIGPGSFTGIRIGVATAKGFHDSLNIPLVGINSLEALAYNLRNDIDDNSLVLSIIDCKNENCYFALFEKNVELFRTLIEPQSDSIESTLSIIKTYIEDNFSAIPPIYVIGDGSKIYEDKIKAFFENSTISNINFVTDKNNLLNSYSLGIAGVKHFSNYSCEEEVLPLYLKKPQAQRQLEEKNKS